MLLNFASLANRTRSIDSNIINVQVSSFLPVFKVHADRLSLSPYLKEQLEEQRERSVLKLSRSTDLVELEIYIYFLYTGTLATDTADPSRISIALRTETALLGKLYKFGMRMEDPVFRNAVLDGIIDISRLKDKDTGVPYLPDAGIFSDLKTDPPAKRCIIDLYVHFLDPADPAIDLTANIHSMREVFKATLHKSDVKSEHGNFRRQNLRKCDYHEHEDGVRCDSGEEK